ncbi:hypothetical protein [Deinococcus hopiensis]|uniref:Uncharacterized protein n=1 Tax=Deinococcus hopiensis KR-140 TaxID=695939 RepID=A0A1W1UKV7_9DEIO|nr:hypothetical protein [Deinococcus hopiensis]SMB81653.1 hypothetical protein SAMN00790413_04663 [Deinococcus hopiensis KR-140]
MNLKHITLPLLSAVLLTPTAHATHTNVNLKDFRTVCLNAAAEIKTKEDKDLASDAFDALSSRLEDAGITVADNPCQDKGTGSNRQLNLFYSFSTTKDGSAYFSNIEAWVTKEGKYIEVSLWTDYIFGSPGKQTLKEVAIDNAGELGDSFVEAWESNH